MKGYKICAIESVVLLLEIHELNFSNLVNSLSERCIKLDSMNWHFKLPRECFC